MTGRATRPVLAVLFLLATAACAPRGATLEILPARPACTVPKVVAVRWSIPESEPLPVMIKINGPGRPMKNWRQAVTRQGQADTGPWASDGLTVTLVSTSGRPLARRTLTRAPCAAG